MTRPLIESDIESYFKDEVRKAGGKAYKFVSPGRVNVPDQIVIWPAQTKYTAACVHFVELKKPGKKPRAGQARELARLKKMGCTALYIDTKELVDLYVRGWRVG